MQFKKKLIKTFILLKKDFVYEYIRISQKFLIVISLVIFFPIWLFLNLFLRLISPLMIIRFGIMHSERIGHFSLHPELYLSGLDENQVKKTKFFFDIWCFSTVICNDQLAKMWSKSLIILPRVIINPLIIVNNLFPRSEKYLIPHADSLFHKPKGLIMKSFMKNNVLKNTTPHISFSPKEEALGYKYLKKMGWVEGDPFICFANRDKSYLKKTNPNYYLSRNLTDGYDDFRNANINDFQLALDELSHQGYKSIRMGSIVEEILEVKNSSIIPYAGTDYRSDFMDMFLSAKCEFFLGCDSGIRNPSMVFRKPQLAVSMAPFFQVTAFCFEFNKTMFNNILYIPKMYKDKLTGKLLSCKQIVETKSYSFNTSKMFHDNNIELLDNSPIDILDLTMEAINLKNEKNIYSNEDEYLQRLFWSYCPEELKYSKISSRVGKSFLRKYKEILL